MQEGQETAAQEESTNVKVYSSTGKSSKGKIFFILGMLILLLLVGGGYYWFGYRQKEQPVEPVIQTELEQMEPTIEATITPEEEASPSPTLSATATATPTSKPTATPTPIPTPALQSKVFDSSADLDGFRSSNGGGNNMIEVRVGRNVNLITRGFVSFGIGDIPEDASISKVTLRLYQAQTVGNPYGIGSRVMLDHLDYGTSLENADYSADSISSSFTKLSDNATVGWKEVEVTDAVREDFDNNMERSQFRLHMASETIGGDVTGDFAYFESANNSLNTGNTPKLVVDYY